jgi:hypothetical protein
MAIKIIPGNKVHTRVWRSLFLKWQREWIAISNGRGIMEMSQPYLHTFNAKMVKDQHTAYNDAYGPSIEFDTEEDLMWFLLCS